jgi:hypothetical protein
MGREVVVATYCSLTMASDHITARMALAMMLEENLWNINVPVLQSYWWFVVVC